jgi:hypothetical protein
MNTLRTNGAYNSLKKTNSESGQLLNLLESQEAEITRLNKIISEGVSVDTNEIKKQIRLELTQKFDILFTDSLTLIGASTQQLKLIRDSILGVQQTPPVVPEPEPLIPNL